MQIHAILLIVVIVVVGFNSLMTFTKNVLDKVAANSEADKVVTTIAGFTSKVVGILSANTQALPSDIQKELPAPAPAAPASAPAQAATGA